MSVVKCPPILGVEAFYIGRGLHHCCIRLPYQSAHPSGVVDGLTAPKVILFPWKWYRLHKHIAVAVYMESSAMGFLLTLINGAKGQHGPAVYMESSAIWVGHMVAKAYYYRMF